MLPVTVPEANGDASDLAGQAVGVSGKLLVCVTKVVEQRVEELVQVATAQPHSDA